MTTRLAFLAALGFWTSSLGAQAPRPNVLLIISDDQGYGDFGFIGNELVRTPNLDRLAGQSPVLKNFAVAPACSPTACTSSWASTSFAS